MRQRDAFESVAAIAELGAEEDHQRLLRAFGGVEHLRPFRERMGEREQQEERGGHGPADIVRPSS